jgi:hypothetical protein
MTSVDSNERAKFREGNMSDLPMTIGSLPRLETVIGVSVEDEGIVDVLRRRQILRVRHHLQRVDSDRC